MSNCLETMIVTPTSISSFHLNSRTAMAAKDPDPRAVKGKLSLDPWAWTVQILGPVQSIPPKMR